MELYVQRTASPSQCVHLQYRIFDLGRFPETIALSIGVVHTIWSGDLDALKEILETQALVVGRPAPGESEWLPTFTKKVEA